TGSTWTPTWRPSTRACSSRPATAPGCGCATASPARTSTPWSRCGGSTGAGTWRISCATPRPPWAATRGPLGDNAGNAHPTDPAVRRPARAAVPRRARRYPAATGAAAPPSQPRARAPAVVVAPARRPARALDRAEDPAGGRPRQRWPTGLLRARGLRAVECPDPGPRLPPGRHALAAAPAARRSARPQARLRGAVAAQRRQHPGARRQPGHQQAPGAGEVAFGLAGAPARGAPRRPRAGRAAGPGLHLRRPLAGQAERLVLG